MSQIHRRIDDGSVLVICGPSDLMERQTEAPPGEPVAPPDEAEMMEEARRRLQEVRRGGCGAQRDGAEGELEDTRTCEIYKKRSIDFYTTRGVTPWWSGERMQLYRMKHRLLYNQRSPLVVRRENAALTHEA